jgi:Predicted transcriptional regulators
MKDKKNIGNMTLGNKIRMLRLDRKITQQELVGDFITRNMLSQIENDVATPSMKTLQYLAETLEVPLSYLVDNDNESEFDEFIEYRHGTREEILLDVEKMHRSFLNNRLDECMECCERLEKIEVKGEFLSSYVQKQINLYKLRCLSMEGMKMNSKEYLEKTVDETDLCRYNILLAEKFAKEKESEENAMQNALDCLKYAENIIERFPQHPYKSEVYKALENCYVSMEDYKNAHLYSTKLLELLQK